MLDGRIVERGTYAELMANDGAFAKFVNEFGSKDEKEAQNGEEVGEQDVKQKKKKGSMGGQMMQAEERNTGAVSNASTFVGQLAWHCHLMFSVSLQGIL